MDNMWKFHPETCSPVSLLHIFHNPVFPPLGITKQFILHNNIIKKAKEVNDQWHLGLFIVDSVFVI